MQLLDLANHVTELMKGLNAPIIDYHVNARGVGGLPLVELITSPEAVDAIAEAHVPVDDEYRTKGIHPVSIMETNKFTYGEIVEYCFTHVTVDNKYQLQAFSPVNRES